MKKNSQFGTLSQPFLLTWKISLAGWPSSKSVGMLPSRRLSVRALRCWEILLPRERQAAQRYTRLAQAGAGAGISRIRVPAKPARAVPPKCEVPPRQPLDLAEVLAKLAAVLDKPRSSRSVEREFGVDPGVATTETEYTQRLNDHAQAQRILRTRHESPGIIIMAHETRREHGKI